MSWPRAPLSVRAIARCGRAYDRSSRRRPVIHPVADLLPQRRAGQAITGLGGGQRAAAGWGLSSALPAPSLDPLRFVASLALRGTALLDELLGALASDLDLPLPGGETLAPQKLARLRLLSGMDPLYEETAKGTA